MSQAADAEAIGNIKAPRWFVVFATAGFLVSGTKKQANPGGSATVEDDDLGGVITDHTLR